MTMPSDFGDYEILEQLGCGAMAQTFKARAFRGPHAGRLVCLKVIAYRYLTPHMTPSARESAMRAMRRESAILGKFRHPNLSRLLDVDKHRFWDFLVLELVDGANLRQVLMLRGPLPPCSVWCIAMDGASALACAHAYGVLHRDIKPANVMVSSRGRTRIIDFGLGKLRWARALSFTRGIGTPRYSAPEQLGFQDLCPRADIYSFGVVLFEALTGCHPYGDPDDKRFRANVCEGRLQHHLRGHSVPPKLAAIVMRCIDCDPSRRFKDGHALATALHLARPVIADGRMVLGAAAAAMKSYVQYDPFAHSSGSFGQEPSSVGA